MIVLREIYPVSPVYSAASLPTTDSNVRHSHNDILTQKQLKQTTNEVSLISTSTADVNTSLLNYQTTSITTATKSQSV